MMSYTVRYERDESGWWIAEVVEVQGCRTQARSLREARRRIRDALSLFVEDAETAKLTDNISLPAKIRDAIAEFRKARKAAQEAHVRALAVSASAVLELNKKCGLSMRDVGELLGLSHQRIQQLKR